MPIYALLSRIRLNSSPEVIQSAERLLEIIVKIYFEPNLTPHDIRHAASKHNDHLQEFSHTCRRISNPCGSGSDQCLAMQVSKVRRTGRDDGASAGLSDEPRTAFENPRRAYARKVSVSTRAVTSGRKNLRKDGGVSASRGWHLDCVGDGCDCSRSMSPRYSDDRERCARHLAAGSFAGVLPGPPCGDSFDPLAVSALTVRQRPLVQDDGRFRIPRNRSSSSPHARTGRTPSRRGQRLWQDTAGTVGAGWRRARCRTADRCCGGRSTGEAPRRWL